MFLSSKQEDQQIRETLETCIARHESCTLLWKGAKDSVNTTLPEGDEEAGTCAWLMKTMYGAQDASHVWQMDYTDRLQTRGCISGSAWTSVFRNDEADFFVLGSAHPEGVGRARRISM